jgi:hypothetical protein
MVRQDDGTETTYQDLGLTPQEIEELSDAGHDINVNLDVKAIDKLAQLYLNAGLDSEAERILGLKDKTVNYVQSAVYENTGYAVNYNDEIGQWYFLGGQGDLSGKLIGNLGFDRTMSNDEYSAQISGRINNYT